MNWNEFQRQCDAALANRPTGMQNGSQQEIKVVDGEGNILPVSGMNFSVKLREFHIQVEVKEEETKNVEHGLITSIRFIDDSERGYDSDPVRFVGIGDDYNGMHVLGITVEYPSERRLALVTFHHGDMVTVIPDCRVVHYTARTKK